MRYFKHGIALIALSCGTSALLQGQVEFGVAGRKVQVHGFASQSFMYSHQNNFASMKTSDGSFGLTDGGLNMSTALTDKFRVGAQMYVRHLGDLSNGVPELDWAYADYRFTPWLGVRGGKVKTALGLYNDTQDLDFLNTWALLPQGMYPIDLRSVTIAHQGGDVYGSIDARKLGTFSYTGYIGWRPHSDSDGYLYGLRSLNINLNTFTGKMFGGDLRWNTPVNGLLVGASILQQNPSGQYISTTSLMGPVGGTIDTVTRNNQTIQYYGQYQNSRLRVDAEYRRNWRAQGYVGVREVSYDGRAWYISGAFRIAKWLEVGGYRSQYVADSRKTHDDPTNHVFDWVATARFDVNRYWNWKVEGHFMDGYAAGNNAHGFYPQTNPGGLKPDTHMLVVRTGFNF